MFPVIVAATLSSLQRTRLPEGATCDTGLCAVDEPIAECLLNAGQPHAKEVELQGRKTHKLGAPHISARIRVAQCFATTAVAGGVNQK